MATCIVCLTLMLRQGINPQVDMLIMRHHLSRNQQTVQAFHQSKQNILFQILVTQDNAAMTLSITIQQRVIFMQKVRGTSLNASATNDKFSYLQAGSMNLTIRILLTNRHKNETKNLVIRYLMCIFNLALCYSTNLWYIGKGVIRYRNFLVNLFNFFYFYIFDQCNVYYFFSFCSFLSQIQLSVLVNSAQLSTTMNIRSVKYILYVFIMYMLLIMNARKDRPIMICGLIFVLLIRSESVMKTMAIKINKQALIRSHRILVSTNLITVSPNKSQPQRKLSNGQVIIKMTLYMKNKIQQPENMDLANLE